MTPASSLFFKELEEAMPGRAPLVYRRFEGSGGSSEVPPEVSFVVLQMNVMADVFSGADNYTRVEPRATAWEYRKYRLLEEILRHDPDIITLQEVDHFWDWFEPRLATLGYAAAFLRKPCSRDGAATFVKRSKFELSIVQSLNYMHDGRPENQVALGTVLRVRGGTIGAPSSAEEEVVLVVNTHLKAAKDQDGEQTRERQVGQLSAFVEAIRHAYRESRGRSLPCLVCGDFNAAPHDSPTYAARAVPAMVRAGFRSAYDVHDPSLYTTWKFRPGPDGGEKEVIHMIDYILLKDGGDGGGDGDEDHDGGGETLLSVTALLSIPTAAQVGPNALPSLTYPSDHLSIGARVSLLPRINRQAGGSSTER